MAYAGYLLYMYLSARQMDTCVSLACCLWTCLLSPPVVPQSKEHKVNNLKAADERATNANAQHAAHIGWGGRGKKHTRELQAPFTGYLQHCTHTTAHTNRRDHPAYTVEHVGHYSVYLICSPCAAEVDEPQDSCAAHSATSCKAADTPSSSKASSRL